MIRLGFRTFPPLSDLIISKLMMAAKSIMQLINLILTDLENSLEEKAKHNWIKPTFNDVTTAGRNY